MFSNKNEEILDKYYLGANKLVAKIMRYSIVFIVLVFMANAIGVFNVDNKILVLAMSALLIGTILPTIIYDFFNINNQVAEYILLTVFTLVIGFIYVLLSNHVIMMFAFPVLISCLYNRKEYAIYSTIVSIFVITGAHIIEQYMGMMYAYDYGSVSRNLCYGLLPRLLEFIGIACICICISHRNRNLIEEITEYSEKQIKNKDGLHSMVIESDNLIGARDAREVLSASIVSVKSIISIFNDIVVDNFKCFSGICADEENREYFLMDNFQSRIDDDIKKGIVLDDCIKIVIDNEIITIPIKYGNRNSKIKVTDKYCLMCFYNNKVLSEFLVVIQNIHSTEVEMLDLLQVLYNNIHKALDNCKLNRDMLDAQRELVCSFAEIGEFKSEQFGQHIKRVGEYMKLVGEILELPEKEKEYLSLASMLHDIGKLVIPSEILDKPGKLTQDEFEVIKTHVAVGCELLKNCPGDIMSMAKDIAYHHHEKWDGTGYMKLKGEEINYYARYVAVIDVFDALVSERSYKHAWTAQEAYDEIVSQKGSHFAPEAVELFVDNYDKFLNILNSYPDSACSNNKSTA